MAVDMAIVWFLTASTTLPVVFVKTIAAEVAVLNNFFWNDLWTFNDGTRDSAFRARVRRFLKFNLIYVGGVLFSIGLLTLQVTLLGMSLLVANFFSIVVASVFNFFLVWKFGGDPKA